MLNSTVYIKQDKFMVSPKIFKSHETLIYFHVCARQEAENYKDLISKLIPEPLILFNLIFTILK